MRYERNSVGDTRRPLGGRSGPSINNRLGLSLKITGEGVEDAVVRWESEQNTFYFGAWDDDNGGMIDFFKIRLIPESGRDLDILRECMRCRINSYYPITNTHSMLIAFVS